MATYKLEFYEDERGDKPVHRWIREELTLTQRYELGQAMREQLQEKGVGVCATEHGKQLGRGLERVSKLLNRFDRGKMKVVAEDRGHVRIERRTDARKRRFLCDRDER